MGSQRVGTGDDLATEQQQCICFNTTQVILPSPSPILTTVCSSYLHLLCVLSRFSHVLLFATLWTIAHKAPLSMGFSRQEYWSGCHFLLQGIFTNQDGTCLIFPALAGGFFTSSITWEAALQIGSSVPPFWIPCIYVNT